ncbi:unnamed protein product [Ectocarpus sp. 8 AP-2014]
MLLLMLLLLGNVKYKHRKTTHSRYDHSSRTGCVEVLTVNGGKPAGYWAYLESIYVVIVVVVVVVVFWPAKATQVLPHIRTDRVIQLTREKGEESRDRRGYPLVAQVPGYGSSSANLAHM